MKTMTTFLILATGAILSRKIKILFVGVCGNLICNNASYSAAEVKFYESTEGMDVIGTNISDDRGKFCIGKEYPSEYPSCENMLLKITHECQGYKTTKDINLQYFFEGSDNYKNIGDVVLND